MILCKMHFNCSSNPCTCVFQVECNFPSLRTRHSFYFTLLWWAVFLFEDKPPQRVFQALQCLYKLHLQLLRPPQENPVFATDTFLAFERTIISQESLDIYTSGFQRCSPGCELPAEDKLGFRTMSIPVQSHQVPRDGGSGVHSSFLSALWWPSWLWSEQGCVSRPFTDFILFLSFCSSSSVKSSVKGKFLLLPYKEKRMGVLIFSVPKKRNFTSVTSIIWCTFRYRVSYRRK